MEEAQLRSIEIVQIEREKQLCNNGNAIVEAYYSLVCTGERFIYYVSPIPSSNYQLSRYFSIFLNWCKTEDSVPKSYFLLRPAKPRMWSVYVMLYAAEKAHGIWETFLLDLLLNPYLASVVSWLHMVYKTSDVAVARCHPAAYFQI